MPLLQSLPSPIHSPCHTTRFSVHGTDDEFGLLKGEDPHSIAIALENYAADPFHRQDVKKVKGCPPETPRYMIRIGVYRATFRIIQDQLVICVVAVGKKKNFEY